MSELNYGRMMQRAMQGLMAEALGEVAEHGLPGDHHFYITFSTSHLGVSIPDWLEERVGDELTIVLQHQFADLVVSPEGFSVRVFFQGRPADMTVPFDAVKQFADPSAEFGLRFDPMDDADDDDDSHEAGDDSADDDAASGGDDAGDGEKPSTAGEVVSLDAFRKK